MDSQTSAQQRQKVFIDIVGGRFDKVTTVLEEFGPGDERFIHSYEKMGLESRQVGDVEGGREVEVKVPARLHLNVFDMNRLI